MVCSLSEVFLHAQQEINSRNIDPMSDLRVPHSLFETLHTGLNSVYVKLDSSGKVSSELLHSVQSEVNSLSGSFDSMINTRKMNSVSDEDRAFLQSLIDRIDTMIENLEGSDAEENSEIVEKTRSMCQYLKDKIA